MPLHSARLVGCEAAAHDANKQRAAAFAEMLAASTQVGSVVGVFVLSG